MREEREKEREGDRDRDREREWGGMKLYVDRRQFNPPPITTAALPPTGIVRNRSFSN